MVDVRDTEDIWCIGTIKGIYSNNNHANTLLIHYKGTFNKAGIMSMMNLFVKIPLDWPPLDILLYEMISLNMPIYIRRERV